MTFEFVPYTKVTVLSVPTTHIRITAKEWPGNIFDFWLPEQVGPMWLDLDAWGVDPHNIRRQEWEVVDGGLRWQIDRGLGWAAGASLTAEGDNLLANVWVVNSSDQPINRVYTQNCLRLCDAPDFACDDLTRVFARVAGEWRSMRSLIEGPLDPMVPHPIWFREGFLEGGKVDHWNRCFPHCFQPGRVDHPLAVCVSKDGSRSVATASVDYECVFSNWGNKRMLCLHSGQEALDVLNPGETAEFRQILYFVDGGIEEAVASYDSRPPEDLSG